jgi:hypothetical protein
MKYEYGIILIIIEAPRSLLLGVSIPGIGGGFSYFHFGNSSP